MWWAAVVAMALGLSDAQPDPVGGLPAAPAERVLAPKHYAQERCITSQAPTVVWSSSVGMGKSFGACLNLIAACSIPGVPAALTRFERASMTDSCLDTLHKLLGEEYWIGGDGWGWKESKSTFFFPKVRCDDGVVRQSKIVAFGWQDPGRALSTEFARIVVDQAEQLERGHIAVAQTRLRFHDPWVEAQMRAVGLLPRQLVLICNADDPEHHLNQDFEIEDKGMREERNPETGRMAYEVVLSQAQDGAAVGLTEDYLEDRLGTLRGTVWWDRLVGGRWTRAEGLVYGTDFNPVRNVIDRPEAWARWGGYPPPDLPRYRAFDFGTNHPFTVAWYVGIGSYDQEVLIAYREGYGTGRAPSEWAEWILKQERFELEALRRGVETEDEARALAPYLRELHIAESWSDHDLAWRTELGIRGVWTSPAVKDIEAGIPVMAGMLRSGRLLYVRDMLVEKDARLSRIKGAPLSVLQEFGKYRWSKERPASSDGSDKKFNLPVDRHNHGLDRDRYMVVTHGQAPTVAVG